MNPLTTGIGVFDTTHESRPIIRMVFALASDTCGVTYVTPGHHTPRNASGGLFTTYDFWCRGLDTSTFPLIDNENRSAYQQLLARTRKGDQVYDVRSEKVDYSEEVTKAKSALLRQFDPLLEKDHKSHLEFLESNQLQTA